jgi:hypothetical protein
VRSQDELLAHPVAGRPEIPRPADPVLHDAGLDILLTVTEDARERRVDAGACSQLETVGADARGGTRTHTVLRAVFLLLPATISPVCRTIMRVQLLLALHLHRDRRLRLEAGVDIEHHEPLGQAVDVAVDVRRRGRRPRRRERFVRLWSSHRQRDLLPSLFNFHRSRIFAIAAIICCQR